MYYHLHTKYDICPILPPWDIMFTRQGTGVTNAHTHVHTHVCMIATVMTIIETKKKLFGPAMGTCTVQVVKANM